MNLGNHDAPDPRQPRPEEPPLPPMVGEDDMVIKVGAYRYAVMAWRFDETHQGWRLHQVAVFDTQEGADALVAERKAR